MNGLVEDYASSTLSTEESNDKNRDNNLESIPDYNGKSMDQIADQAMPQIVKMLQTGELAQQARFEQIRKNEAMYNGDTPPALRGRSNVPFDCIVMGGFIDTLMANTNEPLDLVYSALERKGTKAAKKFNEVFKVESGTNKGNWDMHLQDAKFRGAMAGRLFGKLICENVPRFKTDFYSPDHYDMVTEPQGGAYLDRHIFKFEKNIFRSRGDLLKAAKQGFYNMKQVRKLIEGYTPSMRKEADDDYKNKLARYGTSGVETEQLNYVGQSLFNLTEGVVSLNYKWYYCLFDRKTQTWIRWEPLEDVFPWAKDYEGRGPWVSAATHRQADVFWTKAPADDIRAVGYTMKKVLNLTLDNLEKRNWDQKAYDPRIFTDPAQLLYKQDGLARATLRGNQRIQDGIFSFTTPDTTSISINMMQYLDVFLGKKTGITDEASGAGNANLAAIQIGNIAQLSKRMTFKNQQIATMYNDLGVMFKLGVRGYLREDYAIKLIGPDAADWDEVFTPEEAKTEFSIEVKAGPNSDLEDAEAKDKRDKFFDALGNNQFLVPKISVPSLIRARGRDAGVKDETIDTILDIHDSTDDDVLADAATAIDTAIANGPMRIYRDADVAFVQYILDFANKHYQVIPTADLSKLSPGKRKQYNDNMLEFDRIMALVKAHMPFVQKNAANTKAALLAANPPPPAPAPMRVTPGMQAMMAQKGKGGGGPVLPPGVPQPPQLAQAPAAAPVPPMPQ